MSTTPTKEQLADLEARMSKAPIGTGERLLQGMAWAAEHNVREVGGNNLGMWVGWMLASVGLKPGFSWCASAMSRFGQLAGCWFVRSGRVVDWVNAGRKAGRLRSHPKRAYACYLINPDGRTGHIGVVAQVLPGGLIEVENVRSFEGNTSSGKKGSQSDGDGLFERIRPASHWDGYIVLNKEIV